MTAAIPCPCRSCSDVDAALDELRAAVRAMPPNMVSFSTSVRRLYEAATAVLEEES